MKTRYQKGYVFKKGNWWYVRYVDWVEKDGTTVRGQIARKVIEVSPQYRSEAAVRPLADEILQPVNSGHSEAQCAMTLGRFVRTHYLPWVQSDDKASTAAGYRYLWNRFLAPRCADVPVRDFRTADGQRLLSDIARGSKKELSRYTLRNMKSLMSGIFNHAKRVGVLNGVNPITGVATPKGKAPNETYAYSLEEVLRMLAVVPLLAKPVIAAAAFGGFDRSELRGLQWENYSDGQIYVKQTVWNSVVDEPKTSRRKSTVPVIPPLARILEEHRARCGWPERGYLFAARNGRPLNVDNLARRIIRPCIKKVGLEWHGWHSFRRGLATNLHRLGVKDKDIQRILRHANVSTTMNIYVKSVAEDAVAAMKALEEAIACTSLHLNDESANGSGGVN